MVESQSPKNFENEGKHLFQKGDYEKAAEAFASAALAYTLQEDTLMAAEMRNNHCVALLKCNRPKAALEVVSGTDLVFAEVIDLKRQGMSIANQATALEALKRWDEAVTHYERAAELLNQAGEDQMRVEVMQSLARINVRKGKGLDALIAMQDGLSGVKAPSLKQRILKKLLRIRLW